MEDGDGILEKLQRIMFNMIRNREGSGEQYACEDYWKAVSDHNLYISVLMLERARIQLGETDPSIKEGQQIIESCLKEGTGGSGDNYLWGLLAEAESGVSFHMASYADAVRQTRDMPRVYACLGYSGHMVETILFLLYTVCLESEHETAFYIVDSLRNTQWQLLIEEADCRDLLKDVMDYLKKKEDLVLLIAIIDLFEDLKLSEMGYSIEQWESWLLSVRGSDPMILLRKILIHEGKDKIKIIRRLNGFTNVAR